MHWTGKDDDLLRQLRLDGFSFSIIYEKFRELGSNISRNSLIGRASRLRMAAPRNPTKHKLHYNPAKPKKHKIIPSGGALTERLRRVRPAASGSPTNSTGAAGEFLGLSILEIDNCQCHYPEGNDVITFCAQPVVKGSPYCAHHTKLCYTGLR